jgi:uncharacterized membrane protein
MESKSKIFGHPAHTILIVFPLGLLSTSVAFDGIWSAKHQPKFAEASFWMLVAGLFGWWDWVFIPHNTRAKRIGLLHGAGNVVVLGLFGVSGLLRRSVPSSPSIAARGLSLVGGGLAVLTGWLGGELVDRLGVGVDDGANLDAPNSLTGTPADASGEHS